VKFRSLDYIVCTQRGYIHPKIHSQAKLKEEMTEPDEAVILLSRHKLHRNDEANLSVIDRQQVVKSKEKRSQYAREM